MAEKECPKCRNAVACELSVCRFCGYRFDGTGKFDLVNFITFLMVAAFAVGIGAIWVWDLAERSERDRNIESSIAERAAERSEQDRNIETSIAERAVERPSVTSLPEHEIRRGALFEGQRIAVQVDQDISRSECRALIRHYERQAQGGQVAVSKPNQALDGGSFPWCVQNFDGRGIQFNEASFAALPPAPAETPEYTQQDQLRRWVMDNAMPGTGWNLDRFSSQLGPFEHVQSTLPNHTAYYFARPDMTIIVNSLRGEVTIWRMGRASS